MRRITFFCCFLFTAYASLAQQSSIDSLENLLIQHPQKDSNTLKTLIDLAFYYKDSNPEKGIEATNKAIQIAQNLKDSKHLATAYNYKGLNFSAQGNDTTAITFFNKCLAIRKQRNDLKGIGSALHNIGTSYFNLSDYPQALSYQNQALEIFKKINSNPGVAVTLNSIGVIYLYLSDYPNALKKYFEALHIYEAANDKRNMAGALNNIGLVYNHLNQYEQSLGYHTKAYDISEKLDDLYNMQNALGNMGNVYSNSGHKKDALDCYSRAMALNEKLNNNRGIASNLVNTGILYNGMNQYDSSLFFLNKALKLYRRLKDDYGMSNTLSYISNGYLHAPAKILIQNGVSPSLRYSKAIELQQQSIQMAHDIGNLNTEGDGWGNLSNIYTHQKKFEKALDAYKKHIAIRDSIYSNEKRAEITRMAMQFDFDKKEAATKAETDKRQSLAAAVIEKQRLIKNVIAAGAGILLLSSILVFIFYKRKRDAEEQQNEAEYKAEVAETEMKALRAQMNPHFIFNSLNSIGDYISKHDVKTANYYLGKFAKMMRMILENSEQTQVPLSEDLKALELYMQLEAVRLNDKFTYEIKVDEEIDQENTMVPPLIMQPFVENSIWHGIAQNEGGGKILIEIKKEDQMINCRVEDNGIGRKKAALNNHHHSKKSLGMKITRSRIELMNKLKKTQGSVELFDIAKGTRVEIRLPLALNF